MSVKRKVHIVIFICFFATILISGRCWSDNHASPGRTGNVIVNFPQVSGAIPITKGPYEHFFASYYGITSWSASQRYATILRTDIKFRLPTENDPATLGLVDMDSHEFIPLTETRAWNFQQGCMAHWLSDSLVIYNDLNNGKFVSVIINIFSKNKRFIDYPISAVSPDSRWAVSINFARLRHTRPGYGYGGEGQKASMETAFPEDDGLFIIDLETGEAELICSINRVKEMVPGLPEDGREYFNHTLFSRDGSKIFWLARAIPERNTTSLTINRDGTELRACFPEGWGGSHFDWLNGDELMVTARHLGKQMRHILFTVGSDNYRVLGDGLLDFDGHGTFSPDEQWMVTHTYPYNPTRENKVFLMHMSTDATIPVGRYYESEEFNSHWRCDIHPRWSPKGDMIGFNSTHTGSRQAYIYQLKWLNAGSESVDDQIAQ